MTALFICGGPRSGKTTLAAAISERFGLRAGNTSDVLYSLLAASLGTTAERLLADDKERVRPALVRLGDALCGYDPAFLARALLSTGIRVVTGVRRVAELRAAVEWCASRGVQAISLWIDRPCVPVRDNTEEELEDECDLVVVNGGPLEDFLDRARADVAPWFGA